MSRLIHFARILSTVPTAVAVVTLFAMMAMTFVDVMLRSSANMPIEAATELTQIMMAVIVFSVLPVISAQNGHIAVDLMDGMFSPRVARWRDVAISLVCGGMLWWPAERVVVLAERARSYGDVTEYLGIPQFYIAWFIAILTYATMAALLSRVVVLIFAPGAMGARR